MFSIILDLKGGGWDNKDNSKTDRALHKQIYMCTQN